MSAPAATSRFFPGVAFEDAATAPECRDHPGTRAVVLTNQLWLRVGEATEYEDDGECLLALLVTWSRERVCLEAAEVPMARRTDDDLGSYVVVRLGGKPSAGRVFVGEGLELRQSLDCELETAPQ